MEDWIIVSKSITKHWLWQNAEYLKWWLDLLYLTNDEEERKVFANGNLYILERGQMIASLGRLATRWNTNRSKVNRFLAQLENSGLLKQEVKQRVKHLTICNYDIYRCVRNDNETIMKQQVEQPVVKKPKADPEAIKVRQAAKKEDFYNSLVPFVSVYGREMVRAFFDYWTEPNKSKTKMRFELEKTWDLKRRLNTWDSRRRIPSNNQANGTGAIPRTNSTEARQQRATGAADIIARLAAEDDAH